jgi:hypothetical protein
MITDAAHLRDDKANTAAKSIRDAAKEGIPPDSFWDKVGDALSDVWHGLVEIAKIVVLVGGIIAMVIGGPIAWIVFAAALIVLADTLSKYAQGKASLLDVGLALLACIPMTKGLTTLAELSEAFKAGGMLGAGLHVLSSAKTMLVDMVQSIRALGGGLKTIVTDFRDGAVLRALADETGAIQLDGSWEGEGLKLSVRDNLAVDRYLEKAAAAEPGITAQMNDIETALPNSKLEGLDYRLKGPDSLKRKIAQRIADDGGAAGDYIGDMRDTVRYTLDSPAEHYAAEAQSGLEQLQSAGFEQLGEKNFWSPDGYQGVNTTWRDPVSGHTFEVQFHTPESHTAKEVTHGIYEKQRLLEPGSERWMELQQQQNDIFSSVPIPEGADTVGLGGP